MHDTDEEIDWQMVRRAMQNKVDATGLRELARDLGAIRKVGEISPSGLQKFLDGATPQRNGPTFVQWFLQEGVRWGSEDDVLLAAIAVILRHATPDRRREVRQFIEAATGIDER